MRKLLLLIVPHAPSDLFDAVQEQLERYDRIVTWGSMVSEYITRLNGYSHYMLPHPSGLNRLLNNPMYVKSKLDGCKRYLEE